jgi:hypothetical protein
MRAMLALPYLSDQDYELGGIAPPQLSEKDTPPLKRRAYITKRTQANKASGQITVCGAQPANYGKQSVFSDPTATYIDLTHLDVAR